MKPSEALSQYQFEGLIDELAERERQDVARYAFLVGDVWLMLGSTTNAEVINDASVFSIPNTPDWFLGLVNQRGNLVPVFDLKQLFGMEPAVIRKSHMLVIDEGQKSACVLVDELPKSGKNMQRLGKTPPMPDSLSGHLGDAYHKDNMVWVEFDHRSFFNSLSTRF